MERDSVQWVTIYDDEHGFEPNYVTSLLPMIANDLTGSQALAKGGWLFKHAKGYDIAEARNEATAEFLKSDVEWMFFIDSDMGWEADALDRLLAVADRHDRPIVGGLCFGYTPTEDGVGEANGAFRYPFPTLYDLSETEDDMGFRVRWNYRPAALQPVGATGAAFLLIHRNALNKIADKYGPTWWSRMTHPKAKKRWGEDTSFCVRAGTCGIPIFVDTRVRTSHLKPIYVSEVTYSSQIQPPLADETIDVIVPVLGRPQHAGPFVRSLRATTGLAHVTAVANPDDTETIAAWMAEGVDVMLADPDRTTFAKKVNDAYRATSRPWMLLVGSDVVFKPGWWDHALNTARTHNANVVATNDVCNGDVRDGLLATHPVIRRQYIDEHGGSWDGPGSIAHEGYSHWWVDAEWSTVALSRGTLVPALGSVVEHLHPMTGKSEMDATYELGQKDRDRDKALFTARAKQFGKAA